MTEAKAPAAPAATAIVPSPKSAQASTPAAPDYKGTKHRVPVDGVEIEVDYEELRRGYTHGKAANQRFQKAAEIEKAATAAKAYTDGILKRFDDPRDAIGLLTEKFGRDKAKGVIEDWLIEQMDYDALPPAEKRARELEGETKSLKEQLEEERKEKAEARRREIEDKAHSDIDAEVAQALQKIGRKPTPRMVLRVVEEMILRGSVSNERVGADQAVQHSQEAIWGDIAEYLEHTPIEEALKRLPKPFIEALQKHQVSQVLGDKQQRRPRAEPTSSGDKKPKGIDAWFNDKERKLQRRRG